MPCCKWMCKLVNIYISEQKKKGGWSCRCLYTPLPWLQRSLKDPNMPNITSRLGHAWNAFTWPFLAFISCASNTSMPLFNIPEPWEDVHLKMLGLGPSSESTWPWQNQFLLISKVAGCIQCVWQIRLITKSAAIHKQISAYAYRKELIYNMVDFVSHILLTVICLF